MEINAPWLKFYGDVPHTLDYPDCSMAELALRAAAAYPGSVAYDFFGSRATYRAFANEIRTCARGLRAIGIKPGERVTICMPNTPQAVIMFYAVNLIGAVANMIHPLSAREEIVRYLNDSGSVTALTLDQFYPVFSEIMDRVSIKTLILAGIGDGLRGITAPLYLLTKGRGIRRVRSGGRVLRYRDLLARGRGYKGIYLCPGRGDDVAAILYSGGTTGITKGILLTNLNFNALALQTAAAGQCVTQGHKMLAIMPVFHGFGLGVCIHTAFVQGAACILVPQFSVATYAELLQKHRPHYIAGVPTLFEALLRIPAAHKIDMSQLEGVFSGGDSLSVELKRKVDAFLRERGAKVQIREGYGLTECVTASCLTPRDWHREGSIGIPYPDTFYKIVRPGTRDAAEYGETGEICLSGPSVMKGYADNDEETALVLMRHDDGRVWLHTGDLGMMDEDGFIYFRQRLKRVIMSSGYSVFPSQIENVIDAHENVLISCVIGIPDEYRGRTIKAFVVPREGVAADDALKADIMEHCRQHVARYAMPRDIEFRDELPKTLVGKVAYAVLEREEAVRASGSQRGTFS